MQPVSKKHFIPPRESINFIIDNSFIERQKLADQSPDRLVYYPNPINIPIPILNFITLVRELVQFLRLSGILVSRLLRNTVTQFSIVFSILYYFQIYNRNTTRIEDFEFKPIISVNLL